MISCSHCREKLSEFLDETLVSPERDAVAAHLKSCAECAQVAPQLGNLRATLREIPPVIAPASLRQNVRAALQNDIKSRAPKPLFGWRPTQLVWTGSLALAALTLMIVASPFSQSLLSDETISESPVSEETNRPAKVSSPQTSASSPTGKSGRVSVRESVAPATRKSNLSQAKVARSFASTKNPASPQVSRLDRRPDLASPVENDVVSGAAMSRPGAPIRIQPAPRRADSNLGAAIQPGAESAKPGDSTKNEGRAPAVPKAPKPETNRAAAATNANDSAVGSSFSPPSLPSPIRSESTPSVSEAARRDFAAPRQRTPLSANSESPELKVRAEKTRGNTASSSNRKKSGGVPNLARTATPRFVFALQAVPELSSVSGALSDQALESRNSSSREAAPMLAPPAPALASPNLNSPSQSAPQDEDSTKNEKSDGSNEKSVANRAIAGSASQEIGALKSTPQFGYRAPNVLAVPGTNASAAADSRRRNATSAATVNPTSPAVRRFRLQIEAPRAVKNAQIRLDLPASLRLLWPASDILWRGDFAAGKAVAVEFSLSGKIVEGRGAENISVIVEQKTPGAQSTPLQTEMLLLPASNR